MTTRFLMPLIALSLSACVIGEPPEPALFIASIDLAGESVQPARVIVTVANPTNEPLDSSALECAWIDAFCIEHSFQTSDPATVATVEPLDSVAWQLNPGVETYRVLSISCEIGEDSYSVTYGECQ